ncbi:MAG TPA: hypothetical protein VMJ66_12525 [Geobacteraceae bacterium]|nr:hypothetical protein [Geobacteraceae bacterium]
MAKQVIRVLVVTNDWEGAVNGGFIRWTEQPESERAHDMLGARFQLGEFVKVLEETVWEGFDLEITRAHRTVPHPASNEERLKNSRQADVVGFRFDREFQVNGETRRLTDYDMVLFFAISPELSEDETPDDLRREGEAIAMYMEQGGGFFATGDHETHGTALCQFIPRVRSMRRWLYGESLPVGTPVSPSAVGADRMDTIQPGLDGKFMFENQSDDIPQPIEPKWYEKDHGCKFACPRGGRYPHPLLCSPAGPVIYLPDHMHEGICEVPDNLEGRTFTSGGKTFQEYPACPSTDVPLAPEIVAMGTVIGGHPTPAFNCEIHTPSDVLTESRTFGLIGAWDGHKVGRGRVVVDSTFHHFVNINLTGDFYLSQVPGVAPDDQRYFGFYVLDPATGGRMPNREYLNIQWYFRNIVYWLIPEKNKMERG